MNGAYLTSLSRELKQSMVGFPTNGRPFYPARAALDPPTGLCRKLFSAIDEGHDRLTAKEPSPDNNNSIQSIVAANAFLQVIMVLRKTFTQDSVLMMELRPCYHLATFNLLGSNLLVIQR
jgi:hypothetical protein